MTRLATTRGRVAHEDDREDATRILDARCRPAGPFGGLAVTKGCPKSSWPLALMTFLVAAACTPAQREFHAAPAPERRTAALPGDRDELTVRAEVATDHPVVNVNRATEKPDYVVVSLQPLVRRPSGFEPLDLEMAAGARAEPPQPMPRLPPYPPASTPSRPYGAGDAVALADMALERGDAFDAAAQYRALVGKARGPTVEYVRLQLARAYLALDDRARADATLRELVSRRGPLHWAALVAIADARCEHEDARRVLVDLAPLAFEDFEILADHMIHRSTPEDAGPLLVDKALRTGECGYAFQAAAYGVPPDALPRACAEMVTAYNEYETSSAEYALRLRDIEFRRHLNKVVERWDRLAKVIDAQHPDPASWVALAEQIAKLTSFAATDDHLSTVHSATAAALDVAVVLSLDRIPPEDRKSVV